MIRKVCAAILFSAALGNLATAQVQSDSTTDLETVSINLEQAVEYAMANNRTLKSNDIDLEMKADFGEDTRSTEYSPSSAAMSGGLKTDFADEEEHWAAVGAVSASLNLSLAYIWQIRAKKAEYENGKISWEQSQKDTILNIKKLFYGLLLQQENLKIQKATLENARQRMVQAQASYKAGAIPELSLLQTQVNYQNTKPDVESAEQSLIQSLDTFAFLLGMPVGTRIKLEGAIEPKYIDTDVATLIDNYGENDLDIRALKGQVDVLKMNLSALDIATWTPALSLNYGWQPAYIGSDGAFHFYKGIGNDDEWYDSGSLSLTLAWNVTNMLPWSSNRQQAKDLKANIAKLELTMETLRENQKVEVRKAVDTLNQAKAQIDAMGRNVTLAQRAYDATYRSYRNGMTELLDLRDAEESLNKAKLGLLNQKYSYISALMDLENTLNTPLSE